MTALADMADLAIEGGVATLAIDSPPVKALSQRGRDENL
jgi:hypothetical protein